MVVVTDDARDFSMRPSCIAQVNELPFTNRLRVFMSRVGENDELLFRPHHSPSCNTPVASLETSSRLTLPQIFFFTALG